MPQLHIPPKLRDDAAKCEAIYGHLWRRPKLLTDLKALELIFGQPPKIRDEFDFRGYQNWMSDCIVELPAVFLGADMGLGKTASSLFGAVRLLRKKIVRKVLIVAPLNVAENTWPEEIAKWTFARDLSYTVVTGDEDERIAALQFDGDVHIINRENVVWLQQHWGRRWPYDMLIYDEASRLKAGMKRTKGNKRKDGTKSGKRISEFGVLARMRWSFKRVVLLSGTPAPEGLEDLWGPVFLIDKGKRLGDSKTAFLKRWFSYNTKTYKWSPHPWAKAEVMEAISDVFFSLKSEDYLDLPELIVQDHHVRLPPKAREQYDRFAENMVLEEFDLEAVNNGVLTNKLLQMANGSVYLDEMNVKDQKRRFDAGEITEVVASKKIHEAKLDALESIMTETAGEPVLLAYSYQFDKEAIAKRFPYARMFGEGKYDLRDWNAGRIRLLVTHPASAGHGMNFQYGGRIGVWYGMCWSLELYQQFMKRLHRSGQEAAAVVMHRILALNTADISVARAVERKGVDQDDITRAVKVDLSKQYNFSMRKAA